MGRPRKIKEEPLDIEHLNLPKITAKSRNFEGNRNASKVLNPDGTRKGGFKSGQSPIEMTEPYKNWMTVQGLKKLFIA